MFDQLVVSTKQRRRHTTVKFFLMTAALYVLAIAGAFAVSILVSDPKLANTGNILTLVGPLPVVSGDSGTRDPAPQGPPQENRPDPNHVMNLDQIIGNHDPHPPTFSIPEHIGDDLGTGSSLGPPGVGSTIGVPHGADNTDSPPRPDPPRPKPAAQQAPIDNSPMRVVSRVLQGKAIERPKPIYPPIAIQIRLQGEVSVEVIISTDGRVESARVVGGHPMFAEYARKAALAWRFQPTLLNNVPVRVTGVILFVFRLGE